jgi:hypothetical protein
MELLAGGAHSFTFLLHDTRHSPLPRFTSSCCFATLWFASHCYYSLGILSISDNQKMSATFYTAAAQAGGGFTTMNFNATPGGMSSLVFGPPPPSIQWSQEVLPFPSKSSEWEFHTTVFDLSVCGVNIMGGGSQWPALIDTGMHFTTCLNDFQHCNDIHQCNDAHLLNATQVLVALAFPMPCS